MDAPRSRDEAKLKDEVIRKMLRPPPPSRSLFRDVLLEFSTDIFLRASKSAHDLNLKIAEADIKVLPKAEALAQLPELRMTALLERNDNGAGLLVLDADLMDGLIEQQTLGEVLTTARVNRPVTDIDLSMSEDFRRALLRELGVVAQADKRARGLSGFERAKIVQDEVQLNLDLKASRYEVFAVVLDLGPGRKTGTLQLWVPAADALKRTDAYPITSEVLLREFADVNVALHAALSDLRLPVSRLMALAPGDTIPVDPAQLDRVMLTDEAGRPIAKARLGQLNGARAVRIHGARGPAKSVSPAAAASVSELDDAAPFDVLSDASDQTEMTEPS